ncbi:unnamed protein product [Rotaria magnacalcarata]|uniref:Uncharacterized protein n=2 Tax=Rotaria magnacalcarata TaxID=392030 RepID=A0A817A551_9BILA|nr:unnamed protein product [Rotaria magnacalcarata]CAF4216316.1 unnamed protein product [Rotaria magnacalcarata]
MNSNVPSDGVELEGDTFFDFVKQCSGEKVANLLEFQDITNVNCLLACQDPLEILLLDSDDLLDLKKATRLKLNNNSFTVLPGVKSKLNLLKFTLTKKRNELKRESSKRSSNSLITNILSDNNSISNNLNHSADILAATPTNTFISSISNCVTAQETIKRYLFDSLDDWCKKMRKTDDQYEMLELKENLDYDVVIDLDGSKVFIRCKCGTIATLDKKDNNYIVSYFFVKYLD